MRGLRVSAERAPSPWWAVFEVSILLPVRALMPTCARDLNGTPCSSEMPREALQERWEVH